MVPLKWIVAIVDGAATSIGNILDTLPAHIQRSQTEYPAPSSVRDTLYVGS